MRNGIACRRRAVAAGCAALLLACGGDEPADAERAAAPPEAGTGGPSAPAAGAPEAAAAAADVPSADPAALAELEEILRAGAPEPDALLGALARVGAAGDRRASAALAALVLDPERADAVRARAAVSLARIDPRAAAAVLARLDPWVLSAELDPVRAIPFAESEPFFRALLGAQLSQDAKRDAIAALADSGVDATPLLVEVAGRSRDPALRATAVDAIAFMPDPGAAPVALIELPARERAPEVRASLYRVLAQHAGSLAEAPGTDALLQTALAERDPAVRLEASALLARLLRAHGDAKLRERFERALVPWLAHEASRGSGRAARLRAVEILALAGGAPADTALGELAASRETEIADAARRALASR